MASCGFLLRLRASLPRITQEIACVSLASRGLDLLTIPQPASEKEGVELPLLS